MLGNCLSKIGNTGRGRVLVPTTIRDACPRDLCDFRGTVGIGKSLAEVDRPGPSSEVRHFREDAGRVFAHSRDEERWLSLHLPNASGLTVGVWSTWTSLDPMKG